MITAYNSTISLAQIFFHQTMPYYNSFFTGRIIEALEQTSEPIYGLIGINNVEIISTFDMDKIEQGIIFDRYLGVIGTSHFNQITAGRPVSWGAHRGAFAMEFPHEDIVHLRDINRLLNRFYSMDRSTGIIDQYFSIDFFLNADLSINKSSDEPQVLIFHTHAASEFFADSTNTNDLREGIVGVGETLASILTEKHGINVIHYQGVYDKVGGVVTRGGAYERIENSIRQILNQHPSIELVIDLHRDGVPQTADPANFRTYIDGRPTASIMFVNGVSAIRDTNGLRRLYNIPNPYVKENLALSFNLQMAAANMICESFIRRLYLTPFRYINHLRPMSTLIEVGTQLSTKEEAHNAMEPLADILYGVLFAR